MRHITKPATSAGVAVLKNKAAPKTPDEAEKSWRKFKKTKALMNILLKEQFFLCCYSELRADKLGIGHHIEHIKPKSKFCADTFNYTNLAASALASDPDLKTFGKKKTHESFGGHFKDDNYDERFVSCHQPDSARFFVYDKNGNINPANNLTDADKERAEYTINVLNLRCAYLTNARKEWWSQLERTLSATQPNEIKKLIASYFTPVDDKIDEFFSVTRQFFGTAAESYLTNFATSLL